MGIAQKLFTFPNGKEVVDFISDELNQIDITNSKPLHPVSLILLDINMPVMDGMETSKTISNMFDQINNRRHPSQLLDE